MNHKYECVKVGRNADLFIIFNKKFISFSKVVRFLSEKCLLNIDNF